MTGLFVFCWYAFGLVIPIIGITAVCSDKAVWKGVGTPVRAASLGGAALICFMVVFLALVTLGLSTAISNHFFVETLRADDVASIRLGDVKLPDSAIFPVVQSLHGARWFMQNHGGYAKESSLEILMRSGEIHRYNVALYLNDRGAFMRTAGGINCEMLVPDLPDALKAAGHELTTQKRF